MAARFSRRASMEREEVPAGYRQTLHFWSFRIHGFQWALAGNGLRTGRFSVSRVREESGWNFVQSLASRGFGGEVWRRSTSISATISSEGASRMGTSPLTTLIAPKGHSISHIWQPVHFPTRTGNSIIQARRANPPSMLVRFGGVMSMARTGHTSMQTPQEWHWRLISREKGMGKTLRQFFPVATGETAWSRVDGASAFCFLGALRNGRTSGFVT